MNFLLRRAAQGIATVFLMSIIVFILSRITGSPLDYLLSPLASEEEFAAVAADLGLDKPIVVQYLTFLGRALQGDLGRSVYFHEVATSMIFDRLGATVSLASIAFILGAGLGVPAGVAAAVFRGTKVDAGARGMALFGQSVPSFFIGIVAIQIFSVNLGWLPVGGRHGLATYVLPAITLAAYVFAAILRLTRSSMIEVLSSDYITLAMIKGTPRWRVIWHHALRNALIPVITFSGLLLAQMLVGAIVVETVFAWPGLGRLAFMAAAQRDYPLLQAIVIFITVVFVLMSFIVDVIYTILDPRVRVSS
jgi:peptide/nickel transport system permease protein